jgi:colanic acid biosynthesis glycosyl transferase WcaI
MKASSAREATRDETCSRRIVIYGMNYAPEIAGVGRYTGEIGSHLAAVGHDVRVVTTPPHYPGWRPFRPGDGRGWSRERLDGVELFRCPLYLHPRMTGFRRLLAPLTFAVSSAPVIFWQILSRRPQVVLCIEPTLLGAPLALLAAKLVKARTILHVQDLEVEAAFAVGHLAKNKVVMAIADAFDAGMKRSFDQIITISDRMAQRIRAKGVRADRIEVVRNWVDLQSFEGDGQPSRYRRELDVADDDFVALYSGSLGAKQGLDVLLETVRLLRDRPGIVFVIAGEGPMRATLEEAASELPNLRVVGFQPEERFGQFLRLADLHVLPQQRDAADLLMPSKLGGMLASGRRIVVTADPGTELADFLGASCVIVPPGDSTRLAEAIVEIANGDDCQKAERGRLQRAALLSKSHGLKAFTQTMLSNGPVPPEAAIELRATT